MDFEEARRRLTLVFPIKMSEEIRTSDMSISNLPEIALEQILSHLTYDEIARNRLVCKKFNSVCGNLLTRGFLQVEKKHSTFYKKIKSQLPRRESERKSHPLSRHCDVLSAIETRISMLLMTYMKYIEMNVCCFIPGKVIDEINRILTQLERMNPPPRTHEILQELRDISSMAMEHFDDEIVPRFINNSADHSSIYRLPLSTTAKTPTLFVVQQLLTEEIGKVKKQTKLNKQKITSYTEALRTFTVKFKHQMRLLNEKSSIIKEQELQLQDQANKLQEQSTKLQEQAVSIADLKKRVDEWDQKFSDLTTELIRAREDHMFKPPSTPTPLSAKSISSKYQTANIKPRATLQKFYEIPRIELDRKRKSTIYSDIPLKIVRNLPSASDKINQNITSSILKKFAPTVTKQTEEKGEDCKSSLFGPFLSSSIEMLLKGPLTGIKSRKRKIPEDIDLK